MSREPDDGYVYLSPDHALEIYAAIFGLTTEQAADHLRSQEAVEGALGRPASYAHYEQADLALQAAVLAHGIAETQSFVDWNKRTASDRDAHVPRAQWLPAVGHRHRARGVDDQLQLRQHSRGDHRAAAAAPEASRLMPPKPCPEICLQLGNSDLI